MSVSLKRGPTPKYYQLIEILREMIAGGELKPGDQLPTEALICEQYGVSRGTVRHALSALEQSNLVSREPGRGTFVNPLSDRSPHFTLTNFVEDMRRQGCEATTRLLNCRVVPAPPEVQRRLRLRPGTKIIHVERLRLVNDKPAMYEQRYLAERLCPELVRHDLENESIHLLLTRRYNIPLTRAIHTIQVQLITRAEAKLLQVPPGTPAFFVDRLTYTSGDRPVVWYQALCRSDEYHFRAEIDLSAGT